PGAQSTTQQGAARTQPVAVGTHPAWRFADAGPYRRHASAHRAPGWRNPAGADPRSRSHVSAGLAGAAARAAAAGGILAAQEAAGGRSARRCRLGHRAGADAAQEGARSPAEDRLSRRPLSLARLAAWLAAGPYGAGPARCSGKQIMKRLCSNYKSRSEDRRVEKEE